MTPTVDEGARARCRHLIPFNGEVVVNRRRSAVRRSEGWRSSDEPRACSLWFCRTRIGVGFDRSSFVWPGTTRSRQLVHGSEVRPRVWVRVAPPPVTRMGRPSLDTAATCQPLWRSIVRGSARWDVPDGHEDLGTRWEVEDRAPESSGASPMPHPAPPSTRTGRVVGRRRRRHE